MNHQLPNLLLITISLCLNDVVKAQHNNSSVAAAVHQAVYHPSVGVIVGMLSVMLSIVFLVLAYAKFCHGDFGTIPLSRIAQGRRDDPRINSSARFSGINQRAIELLPIFRFESVKGSRGGLECAVCINRFEDSDTLRLLPKCKHAFHSACIDKWLESHSTCPLCRYRFDPKDVASSRYSNSMRNPSEDIDVGIFIEREEEEEEVHGRRNDTGLLGDERGEKVPSFHKFRHRMIMSELIDKSRWSDVNSSDLLFLRSEMMGSVSSRTLGRGRDHLVKIKEDIERKRLFESIKKLDDRADIDGPSSTHAAANVRTKKRCMSEISGMPRFALKSKNKEFAIDDENGETDDGTRRVWPPIMRRTLQWFGHEEINPRNSDDFVRINTQHHV